MIFDFVVRRMRWLAKVPLLPHFFDAGLLAWNGLFHRERLRALEALEREALKLPGVEIGRHRLGGIGYVLDGCEFAHVHGNGLLDVKLVREEATAVVAAGRARPHHVFGPSAWVSFWIRSMDDLPEAMELLNAARDLAKGDCAEEVLCGKLTSTRRSGLGFESPL